MLNRKGQSVLEYVMIVAIVVAGLLLMQHYVKHGYSGNRIDHRDSGCINRRVHTGIAVVQYDIQIHTYFFQEITGQLDDSYFNRHL